MLFDNSMYWMLNIQVLLKGVGNKINDSFLTDNKYPFRIEGESNQVTGNTIDNISKGSTCVKVTEGSNIAITNNIIMNCGIGIDVDESKVSISNNTIQDVNQNGMQLLDAGENTVIEGNAVKGTIGGSCYLVDGGITLNGNYCENATNHGFSTSLATGTLTKNLIFTFNTFYYSFFKFKTYIILMFLTIIMMYLFP